MEVLKRAFACFGPISRAEILGDATSAAATLASAELHFSAYVQFTSWAVAERALHTVRQCTLARHAPSKPVVTVRTVACVL